MSALAKPSGWPVLDERAMHGLAGAIVDVIAPNTEADPVALLGDLLVSFGSAIGAGPYTAVGASRHYPREHLVMVGRTGKARKGTARAEIREVMHNADPLWTASCVVGGIASGEGLIEMVRDGTDNGGDGEHDDPGVTDKRLLVVEPEFTRVLAVASREGSIVSHIIRDAWDTGNLRNLTKRSPAHATNAHVSLIGHVTVEELTRRLPDVEIANGFANRFLFLVVDRSRLLPSGGSLEPEDYRSMGEKGVCPEFG